MKPVIDRFAASLVKRYHEERSQGVAHQDAWTASVAALMHLKTGEPVEADGD